jgi:hypothetical protein
MVIDIENHDGGIDSSSSISHYDSVNTSLEHWKPFQACTLSEARKPVGPLSSFRWPFSSGDQQGSMEDDTHTSWATSDEPHKIVGFSPYNVAMNTTDSTPPGLSSRASTAQMRLPLANSYSGGCSSSNGDCVPVLDSPSMSVFPSTPSVLSETHSSVFHTLYCHHEGCSSEFTGKYRRGTLQRHLRLKHMTRQGSLEQKRRYCCQAQGCGKDYLRQDALLKHQRSRHPELGIPPPLSRKQEPLP